LRSQLDPPAEVVVVDSSLEPVESTAKDFPELNVLYLRHWPPSATGQRNAGIRVSASTSTLIGFADDDTTFETHAFTNMLNFWENAGPDLLGAAFNIRNYPPRGNGLFKRSGLAERLGLYSSRLGAVSPSGWQTVVGEVTQNQFVDWIPSTASVFRREVFNQIIFDEFFESYSYLEDVDFGYTVSRIGRLAVVANAGFSHFPSSAGRVSARTFGKYEVCNRLYFVRKHCLSLSRCRLGLAIRLAMSVGSGLAHFDTNLLLRAVGNVEELIRQSTISRSKITYGSSQI
jgi:GT2 family glycosyltransferase